MTGEGHSRSQELSKTIKYATEYKFLLNYSINCLDKRVSKERIRNLLFLSELTISCLHGTPLALNNAAPRFDTPVHWPPKKNAERASWSIVSLIIIFKLSVFDKISVVSKTICFI